ncbi:MAG TPA: hypothetical protein VKT73_14970 [Xanthobacteraceae bacterium]|nr:hypothetical protein [Xanthobacteraceae bacterium]
MGTSVKIRRTGLLAAAAVLSLFAWPAHAQQSDSDSKVIVDPDTLPQNKALDRRFREILQRTPDGVQTHDPWATVRASDVTNVKDDKKKTATSTK